MLDQSPAAGEHRAVHVYLHNSDVDFTGSVADIVAFPVMHDKIEILGCGIHVRSDSGAVSAGGSAQVEKTLKGTATRAALFSGSKAVFTANVTAPNDIWKSFDQATVDAYSGNLGKPDFPTAVKGDVLHLKLANQGSGGTQSGRPYILYRQRPV